jgi:uncharacterized protein YjbI with pentapeptide repeats
MSVPKHWANDRKDPTMQASVTRTSRLLQIIAATFALVTIACAARADIFKWEYINPADHGQGKQQSATLAPDGAGVYAVPGAYLAYRNLTLAYLIGADLSNAYLSGATLTDADYLGAQIRGARFDVVIRPGIPGITEDTTIGSGITLEQLYSTASYQAHDLSGIGLVGSNLAGAVFAGQKLTRADFGGVNLTGADLKEANLAEANFFVNQCASYGQYCGPGDAILSGADLTAADGRGAWNLFGPARFAITTNLILPDGHIDGLDLDAGGRLVLHDFDGTPYFRFPDHITVDQHLMMGPGGTLRMVFEADAWDSTILFAPRIPVAIGGALELTFAADVNLASQVGRTFHVFDWTGVNPTGVFTVSSPYIWDLSNLYTTGEVTLAAVPEPAGFALAAVGALTLNSYRRRKNP